MNKFFGPLVSVVFIFLLLLIFLVSRNNFKQRVKLIAALVKVQLLETDKRIRKQLNEAQILEIVTQLEKNPNFLNGAVKDDMTSKIIEAYEDVKDKFCSTSDHGTLS